MDIDQLIHGEVFAPTVLVVATESLAERMRVSNGLELCDLLAPFGGFYTPLTCQYRVLDKPMRTEGFKVKFVSSAMHGNGGPCDIFHEKPNFRISSLFEKWLSGYAVGPSVSDCLEQPIATLLLVSSEDPNPIECFEQLSHVSNQPAACRQGVLDSTSVRVKILVHDMSTEIPLMSAAEGVLGQLRAMYSPNSVIFLPINSNRTLVGVREINYLFHKHARSRIDDSAGRSLSWEDVGRLNAAVECAVRENAIPWLERKLLQLDSHISAKRKGLRNQLKIFLRTAPQSNEVSNPLVLTQVEWQCRLAGDLAFHLRAYDLALSYYRNVASDFRADKFTAHAAGCYEMSGLAAYLSGDSAAQSSRFFDSAFELYREAKMDAFAIRAAVLQSFALRGRPEAGEKLIQANGEIPDNGLRCAVLLDRAASLHGLAGLKRKEAFTRVLAGHMFNKVEGMKETALVCYSSVLPLYGPGWCYIRDHLLFTMAKLEFGLGKFVQSLASLKELIAGLGAPNRPPGTVDKHANYTKLLVYIGKSISGVQEGICLPIFEIKEKIESSELILLIRNPLLTPIELSNVQVQFQSEAAECEVSGTITLQPLEARNIALQVLLPDGVWPPAIGIRWTLFATIDCKERCEEKL